MPININYEPYGAIGSLAKKSGEAQAQQRQNTINAQMAMAKNQAEAQVASQKFQAQVQMQIEQARMEFQSNMNQQKLQIAGQLEIQEFQRKQLKLQGLMNQIDESDYLSDAEKGKMKIDAEAKFGDISLDRSFFATPKPTEYQKAKEKIGAYDQLIADGMDPEMAALSVGMTKAPKTKIQTLYDEYSQIKENTKLYVDKQTGDILDEEGYDTNEAAAQKVKLAMDIEKLNIKFKDYQPDKIVDDIATTNPKYGKAYKQVLAEYRKQKVPEDVIKSLLAEAIVRDSMPKEEKKKFKAGSLLFGGVGAAYGIYDYLKQ